MSEIAKIQTDPSEWRMICEQATVLYNSRMLPDSIKSQEQALAVIMKGREINMPPMMAFSHIHIIKGKPTISAEGMLALIYRTYPKTIIKYLKNDNNSCKIEVFKNDHSSTFEFTMADAQKAQLTSNQTWSKYPRAMLRSRVISEMGRALFPEALMGCSYTPDEIEPEVEIIKEPEPEFKDEDSYDPKKDTHKLYLKGIFDRLKITNIEQMKLMSEMFCSKATKIKDLEKRVLELMHEG